MAELFCAGCAQRVLNRRLCECPSDTPINAQLSATCYGDGGVKERPTEALKQAFVRAFSGLINRVKP